MLGTWPRVASPGERYLRREKLRAGRWGKGKRVRARTGWRCRRVSKPGPVPPLPYVETRVGCSRGDHIGRCTPPREQPAFSAPLGGGWGLPAGGECWGWGRFIPGGGGGRGRRTAPSCPFFSRRRSGGAKSLSLGHVIVSKRELRGSQRFGDHYKTQPGARVAATAAAAAASPAKERPGRAAAAAARTAERAWASLASSRRSKPPSPVRSSRPAPRPSSEPAGAVAAKATKLYPPSDRLASAASCRRKGRRRLPGAGLPSSDLASPLQKNGPAERTHWRVRGQRSARVGASAPGLQDCERQLRFKGPEP